MTSQSTLNAPADSQLMAFCQSGMGMLPGRDSMRAKPWKARDLLIEKTRITLRLALKAVVRGGPLASCVVHMPWR